MENFFHVAYYVNDEKSVLTGVTYRAKDILTALRMYVEDEKTPSHTKIKYISNTTLLSEEEKKSIRIKVE